MAARPVAIPELFSGEGKARWDDWIDHFDRIADVNEWDADKQKKWLPARLTGRAASVYKRLSEECKTDLKKTKEALEERFEPASRKELYRAELASRKRRRNEDWATYGEELTRLAEKAYPDLSIEAQQRLALNQYLAQLENPQVAFSVKQKTPETVDQAVQLTLQLESYLPTKVHSPGHGMTQIEEGEEDLMAAISYAHGHLKQRGPLQQILQRLEQLEVELKTVKNAAEKEEGLKPRHRPQTRNKGPIVRHKCGMEGHIARGCMAACEQNSPAGEQAVLGALSLAPEDTLTRSQATVIGVVNTVSPGLDFIAQGYVSDIPAKFLIDTGAAVTVISSQLWERSRPEGAELVNQPQKRLVSVQGDPLQLWGTAEIEMSIGGIAFHAEAVVADSLATDVILGRDFLMAQQCTVNMGEDTNTLYFRNQGVAVSLGEDQPDEKPGKAETLSKGPYAQDGDEQEIAAPLCDQETPLATPQERSTQDTRKCQHEDLAIRVVLRARGKGSETQRLVQIWECLLVSDGMLKRKYTDARGRIQLVVSQSLRKEIIQELHAGATEGHLYEEKSLSKIKEQFYWPGTHLDVKDWCHAGVT